MIMLFLLFFFSISSGIEEGSNIQRSAQYYSTCAGINPLHDQLVQSYVARDYLGKAINIELRKDVCEGNTDLQKAIMSLSNMHTLYEWIADELSCTEIHSVWVMTFEKALCTDTITGVFFLWVSQGISMIALFLVSISSSIMMLYFDNYWDISATIEDKFEIASKNALLENQDVEESQFNDNGSVLTEEQAPKEYIPVSTQVPFRAKK